VLGRLGDDRGLIKWRKTSTANTFHYATLYTLAISSTSDIKSNSQLSSLDRKGKSQTYGTVWSYRERWGKTDFEVGCSASSVRGRGPILYGYSILSE